MKFLSNGTKVTMRKETGFIGIKNILSIIFIIAAHNAIAQYKSPFQKPDVTAEGAGSIPKIIEKNGRHTLLVDGQPFFMLGGQAHNSSAWPGMMPELYQAVKAMHLNTLEVPIYWEQIEARRGNFDFSVVDTLLMQARTHHIHLVLLWFGTWKNGSNHYMPEWMKREPAKYPNITGNKGQPVDSPSPNVQATLDADIIAFKQVMRYLKQADQQHTVIMVQVENEPGAWGSVRDYSSFAQKMFEGLVPFGLLKPKVLQALNVPVVTSGTWQKVFGERADEYFQAWSVARFIGQVAAAGKEEYPIPMYVNDALREPFGNPRANTYESGGPTDNVIPIWKVAAPAIDLLAPDIYLQGSDKILKVIDLYNRPDNTLFVPEAALTPVNSKYLYQVIAAGGIGFSPFGIDGNHINAKAAETSERLEAFAQEYSNVAPMIKELAQWSFEGKVKAVAEHDDHGNQTIDLGAWQALISFGKGKEGGVTQQNTVSLGDLIVVQLEANKFIISGKFSHITFHPTGSNSGRPWEYLKVEEGVFESETILSHSGSLTVMRLTGADPVLVPLQQLYKFRWF